MPVDTTKVQSGFYVGEAAQQGAFSTKNVIEDFMKTEYQEGLRNEFNMMDALINHLSKDTITGKKKYKAFALGVADNVRAVGDTFDRYELGFDSFYNKGVETVEAEFDTTKLMAMFSITDEAILKGTGDGSLIDVLKDSLDRMEISLKHTMNRYTYGAPDGKIGVVDNASVKLEAIATTSGEIPTTAHGSDWNKFYDTRNGQTVKYPSVLKFNMSNSSNLLPGMGIMIDVTTTTGTGDEATTAPSKRFVGRIWQKDNSKIYSDTVIAFVEKYFEYAAGKGWEAKELPTTLTLANTDKATVYSRQLIDTIENAQREYNGLEAIVINEDGKYDRIFGVDRSIYPALKSTTFDLEGKNYLSEELLRDMADHLALTSPDGTSINFCCAEHRIISAVEKSLYQLKDYTPQGATNGWQIGAVGANELKFDNFVLYKDKYARNRNVYMLDQTKIGELVRRDFQWITSGEVNSVLQRRPGTEMYEGIMNKYADMYIDAWRCHGAIKNCKVPGVNEIVNYPYVRQ